LQRVPGDAAIRDAITAVFRSPEYSRSWRDIIWAAILEFINWLLAQLQRAAAENPVIFWTSVVLVAVFVVMVLGRGAYLAKKRAELAARAAGDGAQGNRGKSDAWRLAQQLAAKGSYTDAAHSLYRYLLDWLARAEKIDLHPSKTVGDYARELRLRSSRLLKSYRDFARSYEVVVYGHGVCDRERFDHLVLLANTITSPEN
jgi:hypothetical protein